MMNYSHSKKNISVIVECKILDRTHLILDIFAQRADIHARTRRVGTMPILTTKAFRNVDSLGTSRGIGMRGPGKQKLKPTDVLYVIEFLLKDKIKD
jgi:GTP-binding protein HflX